MRILIAVAVCISLTSCAKPSLYSWGPYEQGLYDSYKDPNKFENLRITLESHVSSMEVEKQKVAPGLYAELGTFYLQAGNAEKAKSYYFKERDAWPESRGLMTAMIQNIDRQSQTKTETAK